MSKEINLDTADYSRTESELCFSPKLLYDSANFLYNEQGTNISEFYNFLNSFDDPTPSGNLEQDVRVITAITQHPTASVNRIQRMGNFSVPEINVVQEWMQKSKFIGETMRSHFFPGYLLVRYAQSFLSDLSRNPGFLDSVEYNKSNSPKRLEIHVTNANCNYRCEMCLWHVNNKAEYAPDREILSAEDWGKVLTQAKEKGTETIIFSGGGEPLLRSDLSQVINHAKKIGLSTMIYTNGSMLHKLSYNNELYESLLHSDWLRVSLHATTEERYARLVKVPEKSKPFTKVIEGIKRLKSDRDRANFPLKLGIGFVIQSLNYDQVEDVVMLANDLKLDFLNLRVDCIKITESLKPNEQKALYNKLSEIRNSLDNGDYGNLVIDFDDRLIASMNGWRMPNIENSSTCRVHLYRSAIDPYGRVSVCDLVSEPYYAKDELTLGYIDSETDYQAVLQKTIGRTFDSRRCSNCMPGQQTINALWSKVLEDRKIGINPFQQGIFFKY